MAGKQNQAQNQEKACSSRNLLERIGREKKRNEKSRHKASGRHLQGDKAYGNKTHSRKVSGRKAAQSGQILPDTAAIYYESYRFTKKERIKYSLLYFGMAAIISYLFYDNFWLSAVAAPLLFPFLKMIQEREKEKRLQRLKLEFKDALNLLTASLHTGYAIENAFKESYEELLALYGKDSLIVQEFEYMLKQMRVSRTVEEVVEEFAVRSGLDDIKNFAQIFSMANRSSGGLISIMDTTAEMIGQKIEVEREILTMIQGKKLEQRIMSVVPIAMIGYLRLGNEAFMEILYTSMAGKAVMTGSLVVYFAALWLAKKIMEIKI